MINKLNLPLFSSSPSPWVAAQIYPYNLALKVQSHESLNPHLFSFNELRLGIEIKFRLWFVSCPKLRWLAFFELRNRIRLPSAYFLQKEKSGGCQEWGLKLPFFYFESFRCNFPQFLLPLKNSAKIVCCCIILLCSSAKWLCDHWSKSNSFLYVFLVRRREVARINKVLNVSFWWRGASKAALWFPGYVYYYL